MDKEQYTPGIVYQDNFLIVCEKPYGVSSQKSTKANMIDMLEQKLKREVFVCNRLDITTTGLIVYAFDKSTCAAINAQLSGDSFEKEYLAIIHGRTKFEDKLEDYVYHDALTNKSFIVSEKKKNAKIAKLFYSTEKATTIKDDICSLVRIKLLTGRTHQIRVQFANQGHPLFGDGKYGAKDNSDLALHCSKISFAHPNDGVTMMFSSEPPDKEPWNTFFKNINMAK